MTSGSLLARSRQERRLLGATAGFLAGAALVTISGLLFDNQKSAAGISALAAGAGVMLLSAYVLLRRVRCPKCRAALVAMAFRTQAFGNWFGWLLSRENCPECGYRPAIPEADTLK